MKVKWRSVRRVERLLLGCVKDTVGVPVCLREQHLPESLPLRHHPDCLPNPEMSFPYLLPSYVFPCIVWRAQEHVRLQYKSLYSVLVI